VQQGTSRYAAGCPRSSPLTATPGPRKHKGAVLRVTCSLSAPRQRRDNGKAVRLGAYTTAPTRAHPSFFPQSGKWCKQTNSLPSLQGLDSLPLLALNSVCVLCALRRLPLVCYLFNNLLPT
jgi:hypothetical protein